MSSRPGKDPYSPSLQHKWTGRSEDSKEVETQAQDDKRNPFRKEFNESSRTTRKRGKEGDSEGTQGVDDEEEIQEGLHDSEVKLPKGFTRNSRFTIHIGIVEIRDDVRRGD